MAAVLDGSPAAGIAASPQPPEPDVRGYAVTHPSGRVRIPRSPRWDQLVHATRGVLTVRTADAVHVVPPNRGVWLPAHVEHSLLATGRASMRTLYFRADLALQPPRCRVVAVGPLLRELVVHAVRRAPLHLSRSADARLVGVILDQLVALPDAGLRLPDPDRPPAATVAGLVRGDPADRRGVDELARAADVGRRTLERSFLVQTGLGVAAWRRRARMLEALTMLAEGEPVTVVAGRVGYATPSAFGAAFLAEVGTSPGRWAAGAPRDVDGATAGSPATPDSAAGTVARRPGPTAVRR